jgi:hypothetical protein
MIFLGLEKVDDTKARVGLTHYFPEQLTEEEKSTGIIVDSVPKPDVPAGKIPDLYYLYATKELVYEYKDAPKTNEQLTREDISNIYYILMNGGLM